MPFDTATTDRLLEAALAEGRRELFEHEAYDFLTAAKIGTPPKFALLRSATDSLEPLEAIPGEKLVLKILHPRIAHKTELKGVKIVPRGEVAMNLPHFFESVPRNLARQLREHGDVPTELCALSPEQLGAEMQGETLGVLVCSFVQGDPQFGHDLFLGMRSTREFGPIVNFGLGGVDTELYASAMKPGQAGMTRSPIFADTESLRKSFAPTVPFRTVTGRARGHRGVAREDELIGLLDHFCTVVRHYSPANPDAKFWFTEFEINPVMFEVGHPMPVDVLLRFQEAGSKPVASPIRKIGNLLEPKHACVVGVSSKGVNLGRIILRNLLQGKLEEKDLFIVKEDAIDIDGVKCFPSVAALPKKVDLLILTTPADQVPDIVREVVENEKAESIVLITGGMGEKEGGASLEARIRETLIESRSRPDEGPVMVGGNSLGIISRPGGYDTLFVPETKLPRDSNHRLGKGTAVLSQSGAFAISRMSKMGGFVPEYLVTTGNQVDLGIAHFLTYLASKPEIRTFACYVEGFKPGGGLEFARAAAEITKQGKDVIIYKVGRSLEGRKAAAGHTAALAGDWTVAEEVLNEAGCLVAHSFDEWSNLVMLSSLLADRPVNGLGLGAISNAGYETVGIADNLGELKLATLAYDTRETIGELLRKHRLASLQDIRNPMDLTPMAVDLAHVEVLEALAGDPNVDLLIHGCVPLSPAMKTRAPGGPEGEGTAHNQSFASLLIERFQTTIRKPVVAVVDGGPEYDFMANQLLSGGDPVFRSADTAVRTLARWAQRLA